MRQIPTLCLCLVGPVKKSMGSLRAGFCFVHYTWPGAGHTVLGNSTNEKAEALRGKETAVHRVPVPGDFSHFGWEFCKVRCPSQLAMW